MHLVAVAAASICARRRRLIASFPPTHTRPTSLTGPRRGHSHAYGLFPLSLSYTNAPAAFADEVDSSSQSHIRSRSQSQSQSQSASSARSISPKKVTSLWDVGNGITCTSLANTTASRREQLGPVGMALLGALEDVADGPVFAARLEAELAEAGIERIRPYQLDDADNRPMAELMGELQTIQSINALSHRCAENRDHESEWNNRVHTKVLELALRNDEARVGFRSVIAAKISSDSRPTHSPGLTTGKIVDYAMFLEPSRPTRNVVASLIATSSESINHVSYEPLRTRPIAVSIKTNTESRTVEEAKVQLGVWLAGQEARIEALMQRLAILEASEHEAEGEVGSRSCRRGRWESRASQSHTPIHIQQPTPTPTIDAISPGTALPLSDTVFPLLSVQSESWSLFFGRVSSNTSTSMSDLYVRKPASRIHIFHSIPLGNTANTVQTYRLVKSLKVLRAWIDEDLRLWWDKILGIDKDGD
ncbi:hypothetical protein BU25DRAFT_447815 [Macroventuria anomochaeta]|uniref:Uncharacterized protein n=1 Tax=Macroventuria anomochaeta TaxID=301207 RepID=A0ACB6S639_9PLEO|nr:uncharacterized protein BU25DRAFT_447815 [Macroventuria anomochaeta]KAF2628859.1 hypothetical protein BU25DRAFT_447815 [Macroventuria anomochaeta]